MKDRLKLKKIEVLVFAVLHTVIGVLSVKVFAFLESGEVGKMSLFGGVFFMPVFYYTWAKLMKQSVADVFDASTICMLFTLMCARINCILSGCCKGIMIPGTHMRFPTRELEIFYYIVMLTFLAAKVIKRKNIGEIYPLYMITYGIFRFIIEFFRVSSTGEIFHISHLWAALAFIAGLSIYEECESQKYKKRRRDKI